jgi:ribosomal protein S25
LKKNGSSKKNKKKQKKTKKKKNKKKKKERKKERKKEKSIKFRNNNRKLYKICLLHIRSAIFITISKLGAKVNLSLL